MSKVSYQKISYQETYPIRLKILRPGGELSEVQFFGDDLKDAYHVGGYIDEKMIAIGTILPLTQDKEIQTEDLQIRGMAVLPEMRGKSIGFGILDELVSYAKSKNSKCIWCHAREHVMEFYIKRNFEIASEVYEIPNVGPHVIMKLKF